MKLSVLNTPARYCTIVLSALSYICAGAQVPPSANPSPQAPAQPAASQSNPATGPSQQPNSPKQQKSSAIILNFQLRPLKGNTEDLFDPASTNNPGQTRADKFWVNGQVVDATQAESLSALSAGFAAYRLSAPAGCQAATTISAAEIGVSKPPTNSLPIDVGDRNNIDLPEIKQVDMQFIRQKMTQAAQALSSISPWIGSAITSQYGGVQGSTNTTSYFAAQATFAGQPQVQSTYNTGQPSTVQTSYNGQCPSGYFISGITAGNGITCSAVTATTPSTGPLSGSLSSTQVTTPTPSLQTQITAPAFAATVPAQPAATGALNPTSTVAPNPYDALSQQVELNSELLTYEALYSGLASDNSFISPAGAVGGPRHQVTLAFPIDVSPFTPYKGAVAEVRVFMIPARVKTAQPPAHPLSVVNLLPASNTYNVARATTDTKQFGAGVTLDLIGISATGGKTKSTLYLAKDTDTIALQYQNPVSGLDPDVKTPMGGAFRNLLPVGECSATGQDVWKKTADDPNYDRLRLAVQTGPREFGYPADSPSFLCPSGARQEPEFADYFCRDALARIQQKDRCGGPDLQKQLHVEVLRHHRFAQLFISRPVSHNGRPRSRRECKGHGKRLLYRSQHAGQNGKCEPGSGLHRKRSR